MKCPAPECDYIAPEGRSRISGPARGALNITLGAARRNGDVGAEAAALNKLNEGSAGLRVPITRCPRCNVYLEETD